MRVFKWVVAFATWKYGPRSMQAEVERLQSTLLTDGGGTNVERTSSNAAVWIENAIHLIVLSVYEESSLLQVRSPGEYSSRRGERFVASLLRTSCLNCFIPESDGAHGKVSNTSDGEGSRGASAMKGTSVKRVSSRDQSSLTEAAAAANIPFSQRQSKAQVMAHESIKKAKKVYLGQFSFSSSYNKFLH